MSPRLVSAAEAAKLLDIPATRIRQWASRGRIHAVGLDVSRRPLYDLDAIKRRANRCQVHDCGPDLTSPNTRKCWACAYGDCADCSLRVAPRHGCNCTHDTAAS